MTFEIHPMEVEMKKIHKPGPICLVALAVVPLLCTPLLAASIGNGNGNGNGKGKGG